MKITHLLSLAALFFLPQSNGAEQKPDDKFSPEVAEFAKRFSGKGEVGDTSPRPTPAESLAACKVADGLKLDIVAAEPMVRQPLNMHFDERGRMWVVQYLQYPDRKSVV